MRTPVISRFARCASATVVAAVLVGVGLPVLYGATPAWACADSRITGSAPVHDAVHPMSPDAAFTSGPTTIPADRGWTEFGIRVHNATGQNHSGVRPTFGIYSPGGGTVLRPQDVSVEMLDGDKWDHLALSVNCTGVVEAEPSFRQRLDNGSTASFRFRVALAASAPQDRTRIQLLTSSLATSAETLGLTDRRNVQIDRSPSRSTAPASITTAPQLASTGPSAPIGFLFGSAATLIALGGGLLWTMRRLARR